MVQLSPFPPHPFNLYICAFELQLKRLSRRQVGEEQNREVHKSDSTGDLFSCDLRPTTAAAKPTICNPASKVHTRFQHHLFTFPQHIITPNKMCCSCAITIHGDRKLEVSLSQHWRNQLNPQTKYISYFTVHILPIFREAN